MPKLNLFLKSCLLTICISLLANIPIANAQDLGLCPSGYTQGVVTTGFVGCYDQSNNYSQREDAEIARLEIEAACTLAPRSEITSSEIFKTTSGGAFFARVSCTITRIVPSGTTLCPGDSDEVYRAFNTLVCKYFGSAVATMPQAQAASTSQTTECSGVSGLILSSSIGEGLLNEGDPDETPYFFANLDCLLGTATVDILQCPYSFYETGEDNDTLFCRTSERAYETQAEAIAANDIAQSLCTDTTSGLGLVTDFTTGLTSLDLYFSEVNCEITKPRYGNFSDQAILRACDASCTESIQQVRVCLNGGMVGDPGCFESDTQVIEQTCNTGPSPQGLCPLVFTPATVLTPLLLQEDEEE